MSKEQKPQYGFGGRLTRDFPSQVLVDITEICNLACIHCPHPTFAKSEHYAGRSLDPVLNEKLVDEVRLHGKGLTKFLRYASNGEPTIHKHCFEMLDYASKNSGSTVALTTNAKSLNAEKQELLIATGVDVVDISIDAFKAETYAKIRVRGKLEVTRANVLGLIELARRNGGSPRIVVSYVEQPLNVDETESFEQFWNDNGADYVVIRRLHSCSGAKEELAEERRELVSGHERRPCLYPWERIVLNARGDLAFCPSDWVHGSTVVDYRTTTIKDVWNGQFYRDLRQAHLDNEYENHGFCGQCPDWASTRWPDEGRSYADMIREFRETS